MPKAQQLCSASLSFSGSTLQDLWANERGELTKGFASRFDGCGVTCGFLRGKSTAIYLLDF